MRFYFDNISGGEPSHITLTGGDAAHISRVLRLNPGDIITICDKQGTDYTCSIELASREQVKALVLSSSPCENEPKRRVRLFQGMPKSDKLELITEKATEIGVRTVTPMLTRYCVSRPDNFAPRLARLNQKAYEAAKQCGRGIIPEVTPIMTFEEAILVPGVKLLCYEKGGEAIGRVISRLEKDTSVSLFIGPEGGFSDEEVSLIGSYEDVYIVSMGKLILRTETAAIAALAAVMFG